ncbi:MAG: hypothetical protein WC426_14010 [Sulfuriferula sp.]
MNDSQQALESLISKTQSGGQLISADFQNQLQIIFAISGILSVIIIVLMIINLIYKLRVQSAILRMDKNLQKFVDSQKEATKPSSDEQ